MRNTPPVIRLRSARVLVALLLALVVSAACGSDTSEPAAPATTPGPGTDLLGSPADRQVTLTLHDVRFEPDRIEVLAGEIVELDVQNAGALPHDFTIERIDVDLAMQHEPAQHSPAGHDAHGDEAAVHLALAGGDRMVVRLRVHEPGEYVFYCAEPGHREAGMVGTLIVR
jgi:uncharacterized cupredoxin-like copper-binding protein